MGKMKTLKNTAIAFTIAGALTINPILVQAELGDMMLKKGIRHDDVQVLQQHLIDLGHLELEETTTYYGDMTREAVMDFQKSQGLAVDGYFGPDSFKTLDNILDKQDVSDEQDLLVYKRILKKGFKGEDVQALQESLKSLGFLDIDDCTDYYDSMTRRAVIDLQKEYKIPADGIAGSKTIETINGVLSGDIRKPAPTSSRGSSVATDLGGKIIATARKHLGAPYAYGGSSPSGFDCSGYVQYVYNQHGVSVPRSSGAQASAGTKVSKADLQTGDLVIFSGTYRSGPSHTGIYIGDGNFIHSSSTRSGGVIISNLNSGYYSNHFSYGRRVF